MRKYSGDALLPEFFLGFFSACDERAEKNQSKPLGADYCGECFGQNI